MINIDLGFALGKHSIKYTLEATGKGYVSLIADIPFLAKIKKDEPTFKELNVKPELTTFKSIEKAFDMFSAYERLAMLRDSMGLVINDKPIFELNKLKGINQDFKFSAFSHFFNAKVGIDITEVRKVLGELENALKLEKVRCGDFS